MNLNERNYAGDHLVVGSLEVLSEIKSGNIQRIENNLDQVRTSQKLFMKKQDRYWTELSSDGVITPIEKQQLLKEMQGITRRQAAIMDQAESVGLEHTIPVETFKNTYLALYSYIYTTLKLFDNMQLNTEIPDRESFNNYFSNYYYQESFVNVVLTKGIADAINFRVLENLSEPGEENEIAFYHGGIYMYTNGVWKNMTTSAYRGTLNYLPPSEEDCFFLASEDFVSIDIFAVNGEEFYVNGDKFAIQKTFLRAHIYYCENGAWYRDDDTRSYRYVAAFADYLYLTGELPSIFQDAIDEAEARLNERIDSVVTQTQQSLQDEIDARTSQYTVLNGAIVQINNTTLPPIIANLNAQGQKISHLPVNYGPRLAAPSDAVEGDYYLYTGDSVSTRHYLYIQQYTNNEWVERSPTDTAYAALYMMNLEEILLQTPDLESGYFNAVFAASFIGNAATVNTLATQTLYLREGGYIQSDRILYTPQTTGVKIDYDGNIDANADTHIAGKVAIGVPLYDSQGQYTPDFDDYDVVICGAVKIKGTGAIDAENVSGLAPVAKGGDLAASKVLGLVSVATGGDLAASKVDGLADVATSGNYNDLSNKPSIPSTDNLVEKDSIAQKLGYANWADLVAKATAGETIIVNGMLKTELINVNALKVDSVGLFHNITISADGTYKGIIQSEDYDENIQKGFCLKRDNNNHGYIYANIGVFDNIKAGAGFGTVAFLSHLMCARAISQSIIKRFTDPSTLAAYFASNYITGHVMCCGKIIYLNKEYHVDRLLVVSDTGYQYFSWDGYTYKLKYLNSTEITAEREVKDYTHNDGDTWEISLDITL